MTSSYLFRNYQLHLLTFLENSSSLHSLLFHILTFTVVQSLYIHCNFPLPYIHYSSPYLHSLQSPPPLTFTAFSSKHSWHPLVTFIAIPPPYIHCTSFSLHSLQLPPPRLTFITIHSSHIHCSSPSLHSLQFSLSTYRLLMLLVMKDAADDVDEFQMPTL